MPAHCQSNPSLPQEIVKKVQFCEGPPKLSGLRNGSTNKPVVHDVGCLFSSTRTTCTPALIKLIAALVEEENIPEAKIGLAAGVSAFLWLYACIPGFKPATVVITSELPLGSWLGSSASLCVSLSAALLALSDSVSLDFRHQGWSVFGENELELVNKWAFEGEKIIHGKLPGIDNSVSTFVLSGTIVDKVIAELESCGFQCLIAGIGGNGVEICFGSWSS